jgi:NADP-dependent 3-hydroxy acid dehydrogenase YdfG
LGEATAQLASQIEATGGEARAVEVDVTRKEAVDRLVAEALIDVMVNNAGLMAIAPLSQVRTDEWDRMIDINIKGLLYGVAAVLPVI